MRHIDLEWIFRIAVMAGVLWLLPKQALPQVSTATPPPSEAASPTR